MQKLATHGVVTSCLSVVLCIVVFPHMLFLLVQTLSKSGPYMILKYGIVTAINFQ
jgi:hypothetical protein